MRHEKAPARPDARGIAARVSAREESAVAVTGSALAAIGENEHLNAFTEVWAQEARRRAAEVDEAVARGERLPLAGVPVAVKATEGTGSTQAARLLAAGAVPVGSTSVPGPGTAWRTWGATRSGPTLNPWRHGVVPGGSSAGSAVAVATGSVPLATASDGAGSTRIPAAWCGVVGYKPTTGLLPARDRAGLTVGGPITGCVADISLYRSAVLDAATGSDALPRVLRVAWSATLGFNRTDPEVGRIAERALRTWAGCSGLVVEERIPELTDPAASWFARREHREHGADHGIDQRNRAALDGLFSDSVDLLATPTTPNPPHPHDGPGETMSVGLTWLFNLTGHPAISLPAGLTADGLPVGLQLVAAHHRDDLLVAAAADQESVGGG